MKRILTGLLLIASLIVATSVAATTVVKLDFDKLVSASDVIVVGHVKSVDGVLQNGRVFTHIDVSIEETLKGDVTGELKIVHIGGRTEKLITRVHGMPDFRKGETALLFLEQPKGVNHYVVTGLAQGKMDLVKAEDGTLTLKPNTKQLHTVDLELPRGDIDASRPDPTIRPPRVETLDAARARILELLKSSKAE